MKKVPINFFISIFEKNFRFMNQLIRELAILTKSAKKDRGQILFEIRIPLRNVWAVIRKDENKGEKTLSLEFMRITFDLLLAMNELCYP